DPISVSKAHADQVLKGLKLSYDDEVLTPTLVDAGADTNSPLVDNTPQPLAIYVINYAAAHEVTAPTAKVSLDFKSILRPPADGSNIPMKVAFKFRPMGEQYLRAGTVDAESGSWSSSLR